MHIVRAFCSGVLLVGLECSGLVILSGCGDGNPESGTVVKVDVDEQASRAKKIQERYKANPPQSHGSGPSRPGPATK